MASSGLLKWYLDSLNKRPILTKGCTGALISAFGSVLGNRIIRYNPQISVPRAVFKFGLYGFLISTTIHYWYGILDRLMQKLNPEAKLPTLKSVLQRVMIDQVFFAPLNNIIFFTVMSILDQQLHLLPQKLQQNLLSQLLVYWRVWPVFQLFNFALVPPPLRVLFGNCMALFWNTYLAIRNNK